METYTFYPPQMHPTQMPYQVIVDGAQGCHHELRDEDWRDRISVQDGIVFVTFTCRVCGRQICQSLEEVVPPATWKRDDSDHRSLFVQEAISPQASLWVPS